MNQTLRRRALVVEDEVLVGINRDNPQLHDVYRLSLTSGELVKLIEKAGALPGIKVD